MQISDVMQEAASLLGDYARNIWTDVSIIDYVKSAHNQIQNELILNGMRPFQTLSAVVQVPKDTMELANLPTDFFLPIDIQERTPAGGGINDGNWIPMTEREFEPTAKPLSTLGYWAFRNNALKFVGSVC